MDERVRNSLVIGVVALVVVGLGVFLWSKSGTPEPTIPPGQSVQNPFGGTKPGPATPPAQTVPGGVPTGTSPGVYPMGGQPTSMQLPAKGTVDPKLGFGPSPGAPIPGR